MTESAVYRELRGAASEAIDAAPATTAAAPVGTDSAGATRAETAAASSASARAATRTAAVTWNRRSAAHLIRRTSFGAMKREVDQALNDGSVEAAVDRILTAAAAEPLPDTPGWYDGNSSADTMERIYDIQRRWFDAMRIKGLSEKMTLFWQNHFVTEYPALLTKSPASEPHLCYDYLTLLRTHALGNFKDFVHAIGLNPAMLVYLDGNVNEAGHANENYGRELLELFTMGQFDADGNPNYTENDIKEVARALTGWVVTSGGSASYVPSRHDAGVKSFFGRSGNYDYDDVVDIVFETRGEQIAWYICRKFYTFFVHAIPDDEFVNELAGVFIDNDWDIQPVLRHLLTSEHFYDDDFIAARIKSPVELLIGFLREAEVAPSAEMLEELRLALAKLNQDVLNPPNVAGWPGLNPPASDGQPGHRAWLTTSTLPDRWAILEQFVYGEAGAPFDPVALAGKISDPANPYRLPTDLANVFIAVPLEHAGIRNIEEPVAGSSTVPPPQWFMDGPEHSINLTKILLGNVPHYEWPYFTNEEEARETGAWALLLSFHAYLIQLPEYQLT